MTSEPAYRKIHRVVNSTFKLRLKLQYCNWHAVEAIERKLVAAGRYSKERREEPIFLIWE